MASINMSIGPKIQFKASEVPNTLVLRNNSPIFSYLTLASGGYIINISPMANGILVVPLEKELTRPDEDGIKKPIDTPIAIARKIQNVRYRSRSPSFLRSAAGAQIIADILI